MSSLNSEGEESKKHPRRTSGKKTKQSKWRSAFETLAFFLFVSGIWSYCSQRSQPVASPKAEVISAAIQKSAQNWVNYFHKDATADGALVHEVKDIDDERTTVCFTVLWRSPENQDGITKITATHNSRTKRWIAAEVVETNGSLIQSRMVHPQNE